MTSWVKSWNWTVPGSCRFASCGTSVHVHTEIKYFSRAVLKLIYQPFTAAAHQHRLSNSRELPTSVDFTRLLSFWLEPFVETQLGASVLPPTVQQLSGGHRCACLPQSQRAEMNRFVPSLPPAPHPWRALLNASSKRSHLSDAVLNLFTFQMFQRRWTVWSMPLRNYSRR